VANCLTLKERRTEGKIKKEYMDNLPKSETQNLSNVESLRETIGWHDGFTDAVSGLLKSKAVQESFLMYQVIEY